MENEQVKECIQLKIHLNDLKKDLTIDSLKTIYYLTFKQRNELDQFKSEIDSIDKSLTKNEIMSKIGIASNNYEFNRINGSRKYYLDKDTQQKIIFFTTY